ncbi:unnamed protein product [Larinioides sclopetarius]|uniref:Uncharacterized protein n=1 Tax=Larinioides sclopetarius TaxID=280406 RepID=A0AAV2BIL8_9ARAC
MSTILETQVQCLFISRCSLFHAGKCLGDVTSQVEPLDVFYRRCQNLTSVGNTRRGSSTSSSALCVLQCLQLK